ncbi:DUF3471 domain-containing protein [Rhodanobacter terrae]|uniref:DUF3471 domain-containing protein n=1 Tax=Rhodanobacter terrae TaxID=418647 RepID=A0ABW0SW33_9GAMM
MVILAGVTGAPQELGLAALLPSAPLPVMHKAIAVPSAQLDAYVGQYMPAPGVEFAITIDHGQLYAQLTGQAAYPVYATAADHFFYTVVDARLDFERDASGKVDALVLHQNGLDQRAPRQPWLAWCRSHQRGVPVGPCETTRQQARYKLFHILRFP